MEKSCPKLKNTPVFYEKVGSTWKETREFEGVDFSLSIKENEKKIERDYCHINADERKELVVNNGERSLNSQPQKDQERVFQIIPLVKNQ